MSDIGNQIGPAAGRDRHCMRGGWQGDRFGTDSCRGIEKIEDRLSDLVAPVSVGHQIDFHLAMPEKAAFQDFGLGRRLAADQCPVGTAGKESLHSRRGAPIQVVSGIQSVSQPSWDRNDPLMLVVSQGYENVDGAHRHVLRQQRSSDEDSSQESGDTTTNKNSHGWLTSRNTSTAYSAPSGVSSCLK